MKKIVTVLLASCALAACTRVEPGHVGIRVNNYGSNAGVETTPLGVGVYSTIFGSTIYEYPVYTSTHAWTATDEGKAGTDESISFQDKSGLGVSADVSVAYHVDPAKAPVLFQKYRTDMEGIVDGPLRNAVRNAIVERASTMGVEQIYGPEKAALIAGAQHDVAKYFAPFGLVVDQLYWASNIRLPEAILAQINARVANEQQALAAQASVATAEAEGRQKVARAEAAAKATEIEASAIRTNPEILRQRAIEKWDGRLPTYMGSGAPVPFLGDH